MKSEFEPPKLAFEQIILNIGLTFSSVEFEGDLDDLSHMAVLKKQKDVLDAIKQLAKFISECVKRI